MLANWTLLHVSWDPPAAADPLCPVMQYIVTWRREDGTTIGTVEVDGGSYEVTGLEANTRYEVCVAAQVGTDITSDQVCSFGRTRQESKLYRIIHFNNDTYSKMSAA